MFNTSELFVRSETKNQNIRVMFDINSDKNFFLYKICISYYEGGMGERY